MLLTKLMPVFYLSLSLFLLVPGASGGWFCLLDFHLFGFHFIFFFWQPRSASVFPAVLHRLRSHSEELLENLRGH